MSFTEATFHPSHIAAGETVAVVRGARVLRRELRMAHPQAIDLDIGGLCVVLLLLRS